MVNKVILIGNVGKDPEIKHLENGNTVCNFTLATSESYNNKNGERITNTEWHNIVLWKNLAEIANKYVKKGSQIYIEGSIKTESWEDKDGNKRYTIKIIGSSMKLIGKKIEESKEEKIEEIENLPNEPADDLPF